MARDGFFKELYFHELQRRDTLNASIAFPAGLIAALFGGFLAMLGRLSPPFDGIEWTVLFFLGLGVASLCLSLYFLVSTQFEGKHKVVPFANALHDYRTSLAVALAQQHPDANSAQLAQDKFDADMEGIFAETCEHNAKLNDMKGKRIFKSRQFIIAAIGAAIVAGPGYGMLLLRPSKVPEVQSIVIVEKNMATKSENEPTQQPMQQPTQEQKPVEPVVLPIMPPVREIREWVDPTKKK